MTAHGAQSGVTGIGHIKITTNFGDTDKLFVLASADSSYVRVIDIETRKVQAFKWDSIESAEVWYW